AAEQYLAGRDAAVSEHASDARMPVAGIEIGGGVRMGVQTGPNAVGDDRKVRAGIHPLDGDLAGRISLLVVFQEIHDTLSTLLRPVLAGCRDADKNVDRPLGGGNLVFGLSTVV